MEGGSVLGLKVARKAFIFFERRGDLDYKRRAKVLKSPCHDLVLLDTYRIGFDRRLPCFLAKLADHDIPEVSFI